MKAILLVIFIVLSVIGRPQPGLLDPTFGVGGKATAPGNITTAMLVQPDGKVVVAGGQDFFENDEFRIARFNVSGTLDSTFDLDGIASISFAAPFVTSVGLQSVALQDDGKIVAAGIYLLGGRRQSSMARFNANGSVDGTFGVAGKVSFEFTGGFAIIGGLAVQSDRKIVVGAYYQSGGFTRVMILRYTSAGVLDPTFDGDGILLSPEGSFTESLTGIALQPDGKIVTAGRYNTFPSSVQPFYKLARYNSNGSPDLSFNSNGILLTRIPTPNNYSITSLALASDGKIVAGGFTGGAAIYPMEFLVVRHNPNGTPDVTFGNQGVAITPYESTSATNFGTSVASQSDGKVILAGTTYTNSNPRQVTVLRYNDNGTLDAGFGQTGVVKSFLGSINQNAYVQLYANRIYVATTTFDTGINFAVLAYRNDGLPTACLSDQTPPSIITKNATITLDATGRATISASDVVQSVNDACGVNNATLTISPNTFTCANLSAPGSGHQAYTSNTSQGNQNFNGELGLDFRVNAPGITIGQLGAFDHQGNGITGTQNGGIRVAIFNKSTRTIVPGLDVIVLGNGDSYSSNFRFKNVSPVVLPPGEYVVVAKGYYEKELNGNLLFGPTFFPVGDAGGGAITFLTTPIYGENLIPGFSYPTKSFGSGFSNLFLAGSFTYQTSNARPEYQAYVSNTATGNQNFYGELGSDFRVNDPAGIIIDRLGAFDHQGNGIAGTQNGGVRVAVFNRATRSIVPGLDVVISGLGDYYESFYRFKYITPVTLMPGDYVLVAKGYRDTELNGNFQNNAAAYPTGENGANAITFLNTTYWGQNTFSGFSYPVFAANLGTTSSFLAGTFVYSKTTASVNNVVTITVKDNNGNLATATATVLVSDPLQACVAQTTAAPGLVENTAENLLITSNRNSSIKVFPNPARDVITVDLFDLKVPKVEIQIINSSGIVVDQQSIKLSGKTALLRARFNSGKYPVGAYLIRVVSVNGSHIQKVIVQH